MQNNPPNRKNIRWRQFDYTSKCNYFVTIDVQEKRNLFGTIVNGEMHKNEAGEMVDEAIRQLPQRFAGTELIKYIVMPNHVHLLIYNGGGHYLADMMRWLKSVTTNSYTRGVKEYGLVSFYNKLWQRGYYDRVVRDQWEFDNVMRYIEENPVRWENECNASSFRNEGRIRRYAHTMLVLLLLFFASCQAQTVRDKEVELGRTRGYAPTGWCRRALAA